MITRDEARKYNIKWRIFSYYINKLNEDFEQKISLEVLNNDENLLLRETDLDQVKTSDWMECGEAECKLTDAGKQSFETWYEKVKEARESHGEDKEELFDQMRHYYKVMHDEFYNHRFSADHEIIERNLTEAIKKASILHWLYLPEYEEYIIENRSVFPDEAEKYYDHYHTIEDFVHFVDGEGKKISKLGDLNLDKDLKLRVYSRRWGHDDVYTICRTKDGWLVQSLGGAAKAHKDGTGALIETLKHDSIVYPESLNFAMEQLWELADQTPMESDELQEYLNQMGEWISITEKSVPKFLRDNSIM